jgi:hypothetical protein
MEFTANEYYIQFLLEGLPFFLLPIVTLIVRFKKNDFSLKKSRVKTVKTLFLSILLLFLALIGARISKIGLVIDIIDNNEIIESGVIESIERDTFVNKSNHNYTGDEFSDVLVIDGVNYYIITAGELEVGDSVDFIYLSYSKTVLEIHVND